MAIIPVNEAGAVGIIRDRKPHELAGNAWSDGQNVRFNDGYAEKTLGYRQVFGTPSVAPYGLLPVVAQNKMNWVYPGLQKVYVYDGNSHTNITRQTAGVDVDYTGTTEDRWNGVVLGGVPVLNNGVDVPQMWMPATVGTKLTALLNFPGNTTCKVMRGYKSYLLALDVTKSSVRYPQMLKWSHPADPFNVPSSWSETDPTKDAGEYTFSDTGDWLVDCLPLRDANIVYKENSTWGMQHIGGVDIFRFGRLFSTFGAVSQDCATEFLMGKHLVLTYGDIVVHDGQQADSIIDGKWRKWLRQNMTQASAKKSFVTAYPSREEVWIGVPINGSTDVNFIIIWNWRTGAIGYKDVPHLTALGLGLVSENVVNDTWDSDSNSWDSDTTAWGEQLFTVSEYSLLLASAVDTKLYKADFTTDNDGVAQTSFLERTGIGIPFKQNMPPDFTSYKFVSNIWPRIDGTVGGTVYVTVGTQTEIGGAVTWGSPQAYIIGTTKKIDVLMSGRLLALRISSSSSIEWRLHGYELDVQYAGDY